VVEQIKAEYGKDNVEVEWLPYLLRPHMPEEGQPLPAYVQQKRDQFEGRLKAMAEAGGLNFVQHEHSPNPRRAHECTEYAREQGRHETFHKIVFRKLYGEDKDIHDWAELRAAATEAGLDPDDMQRRVEGGEYREAVDNLIAEAQAIGVQGVPFYIVNNKYGISGAQPIDVFRRAIGMSRQ
jgi:predicted DsbA family dithiol-disulfide isomerase